MIGCSNEGSSGDSNGRCAHLAKRNIALLFTAALTYHLSEVPKLFTQDWPAGVSCLFSSIMRPCCEALERVSRTEEGREAFEERGTGGVLLATIRFGNEAMSEGFVCLQAVSPACHAFSPCLSLRP